MRIPRKTGQEVVEAYGLNNVKTRVLPLPINNVVKFVDGKATEEVVAKRLPVIFEGIAVDSVKLPLDVDTSKLTPYQQIQFTDLEGAEVNNQAYWHASSIRVLKEGAEHE